jgi:potassium-transporting ATPase KdpC subunit
MWKQMVPAFRAVLLLTVVTGLVYPGVVTGLAQVFFRDKANGSMVTNNGQVVGSSLIGQNFTKPEYFHGRPSAAGSGYDGMASSGSNLGPTNQRLIDRVKADEAAFRKDNPDFTGPIPADLLTASGSGLDPEVSPASAQAQVARVAKSRGVDAGVLGKLVDAHVEGRDLGVLGEPRVNVLMLNLALDQQFPIKK